MPKSDLRSIAGSQRLNIEGPRVDYEKLSGDRVGESSQSIRARVQAAPDIHSNDFGITIRRILFEVQTCTWGKIKQYCKLRGKSKPDAESEESHYQHQGIVESGNRRIIEGLAEA